MSITLRKKHLGFGLLEILIAMTLGLIVISGVISMLLVSKSNFSTEIEVAHLQENARFALKFMTDKIRMAGYNACQQKPLNIANIVNGSQSSWYLDGTGLQGYEQFDSEAGRNTFPSEFNLGVALHTDAIIIKRGVQNGLQIASPYSAVSNTMPLNKPHAIQKGAIIVVSSPDCQQVGIFQMSNPPNPLKTATTIVYATGSGTAPGNCSLNLMGNFNCTNGTSFSSAYAQGSSVLPLQSLAFYIGQSALNSAPALFQETLIVSAQTATTSSQELVQGVENMQIVYGLDNFGNDGAADIYRDADASDMNWENVVSVRLSLRLRSLYPVYNNAQTYDKFMDITDTDGSDRFLRQQVTSTIHLRNR